MQKILGLDIGSYSIKAIEILNTFKTYRIVKYYEAVIPEIDELDPSILGVTALKQLFSENDIEVDRIYSAMMGLLVSMHVIHLQNVKKKMIPQLVEVELESISPLNLEEAIIDHQVIEIVDGETKVLAVLSRKDHVEAYLGGLKELNIEPKVIDVDYLSFLNLFPFLTFEEVRNSEFLDAKQKAKKIHDEGNSRLVLDVGHLKTSLVLFKDGKFVTARTIRIGGRYITEYLQKRLNITFNEAQRVKHAVSEVIIQKSAASIETREEREAFVAKIITAAASDLVKEIARTLHSFKVYEKIVPDSVILTGGSSQIKFFPEFLEEVLAVPVRRMEFDSNRLRVDKPEYMMLPSIAQSLAIALRGVPGKHHSQINLRRGELALVGSYDSIAKQASSILALVAGLIVCLVGSYSLRAWLYGKQIETLKKDYRAQVIKILGSEPKRLQSLSVKPNWDLATYNGQAIKLITQEIKAQEETITKYTEQESVVPLRAIKEVSEAVPKDIMIDVTSFSVVGTDVQIEGETDSFANSEKILEYIKGIKNFSSVERKSQENKPGSDGKIIKFRISAQRKKGI